MTKTTSAQRTDFSRGKLALSTEWLNADVVKISVQGEIDAANEGELRDYVFHRAANCKSLILNLHEVSFFSTVGFSTLLTIDDRCSRAAVTWMVIPSAAVSRVLDICDRQFKFTIPCGAV
jgi:anti-anti-sigma factor